MRPVFICSEVDDIKEYLGVLCVKAAPPDFVNNKTGWLDQAVNNIGRSSKPFSVVSSFSASRIRKNSKLNLMRPA